MTTIIPIPTEYLNRIGAARPDLTFDHVALNSEGMVNDVVIVNDAIVFRFGKQPWAAADLRQEGSCLSLARRYVDLRLPEWTVHALDFISYKKIPGEPLHWFDIRSWSESEQNALAAQLGAFLYQMHSIPLSAITAADIGPSATNRQAGDWLTLYENVQNELFPLLMETSRQWVHQHFAPIVLDPGFMDCPHQFMNGDISSYHLLLNPDTRLLNGIIDFGTVGLGDPACDFACLIDSFGESFVRQVARHYAGDVATLIERARFWAGTMELQWLLAGLRQPQDPSWLGVHIGRARDVLPIGSGWD